jgi:hypothetical protein
LDENFSKHKLELTESTMDRTAIIEEKFYKTCFVLSEKDILELAKYDNGPLNNVISNINKECFGFRVYEDGVDLNVDFYYISKPYHLKGDIICLNYNDIDYFQLLLRFCHLLALNYKDVDAVDSFNTFQNNLRTYLEKLGYFTVTTTELKKFKGASIEMMAYSLKGIKKVDLIDKLDFYRDYFKSNYKKIVTKNFSYVYLMINTDTSLFKIGFSTNPKYRERTLHSQEPSIHLIACWESDKKTEKKLHEKFKQKRIRGEWFRLNLVELAELEKFMENHEFS